MTDAIAVEIRHARQSRTRWHVALLLGERLLYDDVFTITSRSARREFTEAAAKAVPTVDVHALAAELDRLAIESMKEPAQSADGQQGTALVLETPEAWPEEVDGAALLAEMRRELVRYVVLPAHADVVIPLWCVHSFCIDSLDYSPRLALVSPEKRSGKSRTLRVTGAMVRRPLAAENISSAALFRTIEAHTPTLLLDECDAWLVGDHADDSLRGLLNAGCEPGVAVIKCSGEDLEPRAFKVYAPVALSMIGRPPATIEDRSIILSMRRKLPGEHVERLRLRELRERLESLRRRCARWAADHADALRGADPDLPCLDDRGADCWRPLVAIADLAGGEWPGIARAAAEALTGGRDAEDTSSRGAMLLRDIRTVFEAREADRISSAALATALAGIELSPWSEWGRARRPISAVQVARLLAPYEVRPVTMRLPDGARAKGYERGAFGDAWERYSGSSPASDPCRRDIPGAARVPGQNASVTGDRASRIEIAQNSSNGAGCHGVTAQKRGLDGNKEADDGEAAAGDDDSGPAPKWEGKL